MWLPDLENEGYISFFIEPLQLSSGIYLIEIRIKDHADATVLSVGQSGWFKVTGPGVMVKREYGGIYVPNVRWDFDKVHQLNSQASNKSGNVVGNE